MPTRLRTVAWNSFACALLFHGALFAALGQWMRIGGGPRPQQEGRDDRADCVEARATAPDEPVAPLAEAPVAPPEEFPEIPRPPVECVATPVEEPEPLVCADPGLEDDAATERGDAAAAPGTIGIGAWRLGGNVRFGQGPGRAPHGDATAAAPALPVAAPAPPPPLGETRPPRFDVVPEPPSYPLTARRRGWEGVVTLRLEVSAAGEVTSVEVLATSGRDLLDEAAIEAARTWRLDPALAEGIAVAGTLDVPVRFRLDA